MNKKWNEKNTLEKIATVVSSVAVCVWLLFQLVERNTSLAWAKYVSYAAVLVICVCEAYSFWKVKRSISYIAIGGAIFMIAVVALEVMLLF